MIKKILLAIMIALPMCAMAQTKIGVINADNVFQAMPEATEIKTQLQECLAGKPKFSSLHHKREAIIPLQSPEQRVFFFLSL